MHRTPDVMDPGSMAGLLQARPSTLVSDFFILLEVSHRFIMSAAPPPPYETAVQGGGNQSRQPANQSMQPANQSRQPARNNPQGGTQRANPNQGGQQRGNLNRMQSTDTIGSMDESGMGNMGMDENARRSMEDLGRELPKGWVRCFDPK